MILRKNLLSAEFFLPGEVDYSYKLSQKFSLLLMVSVPCWLKLHAEFIKAHKKDKIMLINCQNNLRFCCLLTNIISNSLLTKWLTSSCFLTPAILQGHPHNSGLFSKVNKSVVLTHLQTDQGTTEGSSPEISSLVRSNQDVHQDRSGCSDTGFNRSSRYIFGVG